MKSFILSTLLSCFFFSLFFLWVCPRVSKTPVPSNQEERLIRHRYYVSSYDAVRKNPLWVCWEIAPGMEKRLERTGSFSSDPLFKTPSPSNFKGYGYDIGHMCPVFDMGFDETALAECFYTGNVSPQNQNLNRGLWKELEEKTHKEGMLKPVFCICGPLFRVSPKKIGKDGICVPSRFWKVNLGGTCTVDRAWIFNNAESKGSLNEYGIGIRELQEITGISFSNCTNIFLLKTKSKNKLFFALDRSD